MEVRRCSFVLWLLPCARGFVGSKTKLGFRLSDVKRKLTSEDRIQ